MNKKVKQVTIKTTSAASELVADVLFEEGSEGVSVYDGSDFASLINSDVIWDYVDEKAVSADPVVRVVGCFAEDKELDALKKRLEELRKNCPFDTGSLELTCALIRADNWDEEWKKYYSPIKTGRLVVVPEWINYAAKKGEKIVKMDPGQAFGTGEHESTRICLYLLQKEIKGGEEVIDVGCGSGILAAAAIVAGARHADACDIDPVAVEAAERNARLNGVEGSVRIVLGSLEECAEGKYDVILANITADVLIAMSNGFRDRLKEGGALIMSGVINSRAAQVEEAMKSAGFTLEEKRTDKEWTGYLWR